MVDKLVEQVESFLGETKTSEDFPDKLKATYGYDKDFKNAEPCFNPDGEDDDFEEAYLSFIRDSK